MIKTMRSSLCKGLRACGIKKELAYQVLNTVVNWYDSSGPEWTLDRIKSLRQWYEESLGGQVNSVPGWFKHGQDNLPLGVWKSVFKLPPAKALGVLSVGTVLYDRELSPRNEEKFYKGLRGNGTPFVSVQDLVKEVGLELGKTITPRAKHPFIKRMPELELPTIFDMNGSIPVQDGRKRLHPKNKLGEAMTALEQSWKSLPQVTYEFIVCQGLWDWLPIQNEYQLELNRTDLARCVGSIGVVPEPERKIRFVANTNRVTQKTLDPLKWVMEYFDRHLYTSCIKDQDAGMTWVQNQLKLGRTLAGCDLTSASDLLNLESCIALITMGGNLNAIEGYSEHVQYYMDVSRSNWYFPARKCEVAWCQGSPMGTGPSIAILDAANGLCIDIAYQAYVNDCRKQGTKPEFDRRDSGRTIGDDAIMQEVLKPYYIKLIERLGGEVNLTKTITSDKVAEFAGRVITPTHKLLKKVKYCEPSDNSFLSYMAQLGDQAKYFLKPDQRKIWERLKEVPGLVVDGPWSQDSYGIPLSERYQWYLEQVKPILDRADPDLPLKDLEYWYLTALLDQQVEGLEPTDVDHAIPYPLDSDYLSEKVTMQFKHGGDPRLDNDQTLRDVWMQKIFLDPTNPLNEGRKPRPKIEYVMPFAEWKTQCNSDRIIEDDEHEL